MSAIPVGTLCLIVRGSPRLLGRQCVVTDHIGPSMPDNWRRVAVDLRLDCFVSLPWMPNVRLLTRFDRLLPLSGNPDGLDVPDIDLDTRTGLWGIGTPPPRRDVP